MFPEHEKTLPCPRRLTLDGFVENLVYFVRGHIERNVEVGQNRLLACYYYVENSMYTDVGF
jgi:hypothetical protein